MTALLGLLAIAGYQNRDKLAELLRAMRRVARPCRRCRLRPRVRTVRHIRQPERPARRGGLGGCRRFDRVRAQRTRRALHQRRSWRGGELLGRPGAEPRHCRGRSGARHRLGHARPPHATDRVKPSRPAVAPVPRASHRHRPLFAGRTPADLISPPPPRSGRFTPHFAPHCPSHSRTTTR